MGADVSGKTSAIGILKWAAFFISCMEDGISTTTRRFRTPMRSSWPFPSTELPRSRGKGSAQWFRGHHSKERVSIASEQPHHATATGGFSHDFWLRPALGHQHLGDVAEVIAVIAIGPDLWSLGEEHPVTESHDHLPLGPGDAQEFSRHGFRLLQILPTGNDQRAVRAVVVQGEGLITIEVLNPMPIES